MTDKKIRQGPLANQTSKRPEQTTHDWQGERVPNFDTPEVSRRVGDVIAGHARRKRKFPNEPQAN
jgi:hypothetical protein